VHVEDEDALAGIEPGLVGRGRFLVQSRRIGELAGLAEQRRGEKAERQHRAERQREGTDCHGTPCRVLLVTNLV
jgi:hypothetical protein